MYKLSKFVKQMLNAMRLKYNLSKVPFGKTKICYVKIIIYYVFIRVQCFVC